MRWLFLVMVALSFVKTASHPSSHSCPTDTKEVWRLGNWCDSFAEAEMCGRPREEVLVEDMLSWLGNVTWMGMWLGSGGWLGCCTMKWLVAPVSTMAG